MTQRRPHLNEFTPGADMSEPTPIERIAGAEKITQVPAGLDSRGFSLHRIFCMAGQPRCPACRRKLGLPEEEETDTEERFLRSVKVTPPFGAGVEPSDGNCGVRFSMVQSNGNAAAGGIVEGDACISVNGVLVKAMRHDAALATLKAATPPLTILVSSLVEDPGVVVAADVPEAPSDISQAAPEDTKTTSCETSGAPPSESKRATVSDTSVGRKKMRLQRGKNGYGMVLAPARDDDTGIQINEVIPGGVGDHSGICAGDEIVSVGDTEVGSMVHSSALKLMANMSELVIEIVKGDPPESTPADAEENIPLSRQDYIVKVDILPGATWGMDVSGASADGTKGLLIVDVKPGGLAAVAGLNAGDLICEFDGRSIRSVKSLAALHNLRSSGARELLVSRPNKVLSI